MNNKQIKKLNINRVNVTLEEIDVYNMTVPDSLCYCGECTNFCNNNCHTDSCGNRNGE